MSNGNYLTPSPDGGLLWGPLTEGILLRRYKRFLVDAEIDGQMVTAHTSNTGRMIGCSEPGRRIWLSEHAAPQRRYPLTLEMIDMPNSLVGVNTLVPNRLAAHSIQLGLLPETGLVTGVEKEVKVGNSRLDLKINTAANIAIMVEVKNCTLAENSVAYFPDAVTARGTRHLEELARQVAQGRRGALFIVTQRSDAEIFAPADHIDPLWGQTLRQVIAVGVEVWAYKVDLDLTGIRLGASLPLHLNL